MATTMNTFSSKQAGVIYRAMKDGKIAMSREAVASMYDHVNDGQGIDWNGSANSAIQNLRLAVEAIFAGDYAKAQEMVNRFAGIKEEVEEDEMPFGEGTETYTTTTGIKYYFVETDDGFRFAEADDLDAEDEAYTTSREKLYARLEDMNAWRVA